MWLHPQRSTVHTPWKTFTVHTPWKTMRSDPFECWWPSCWTPPFPVKSHLSDSRDAFRADTDFWLRDLFSKRNFFLNPQTPHAPFYFKATSFRCLGAKDGNETTALHSAVSAVLRRWRCVSRRYRLLITRPFLTKKMFLNPQYIYCIYNINFFLYIDR